MKEKVTFTHIRVRLEDSAKIEFLDGDKVVFWQDTGCCVTAGDTLAIGPFEGQLVLKMC